MAFGEASAYPHGVMRPQDLRAGDMVLVDLSAELERYRSDGTRSYLFGKPSVRQREICNLKHRAQMAGFAAAQPGVVCDEVDAAAIGVIKAAGFGPGYASPGLPHRVGHGIGLDLHEPSYIVEANMIPLGPGMCFSDEPTMCLGAEFGVRLEDCVHMTVDGPRWFTAPSRSIDDPFAS